LELLLNPRKIKSGAGARGGVLATCPSPSKTQLWKILETEFFHTDHTDDRLTVPVTAAIVSSSGGPVTKVLSAAAV